jgi:uncharacterized protein (DUF1800 family)
MAKSSTHSIQPASGTTPPSPQPPPPAEWAPYRPGSAAPWDLRRVVHLHRRAAFAATWDEVQRDLKEGPDASIARLLDGKPRLDGVPEDFEDRAAAIGDAAVAAGEIERLQAWWIYRMLFGPDPLGEKLTLLWHNHFATSFAKVRDVGLMRRQNQTQRQLARAPFGDIVRAMLNDAALLAYLDAPMNVKGHPNENLARELMELFTLGIGNYTETDVKESARALTGWSGSSAGHPAGGNSGVGAGQTNPAQHDGEVKVILGHRGRFACEDLRQILLDQPATPRRLAWRLCDEFMGEGAVSDVARQQLANALRQHNLDIGWAVATILRSELFFSDRNIATRIVPPAEYLIGAVRALELFDPPPSTLTLAEWARRLGQELFGPPNVGGWPGGRMWLNSRAVLARGNFAAALAAGELFADPSPPDLVALAKKHRGAGIAASGDAIVFFRQLLLGGRHGDVEHAPLAQPEKLRESVALLIAGPDGQLA